MLSDSSHSPLFWIPVAEDKVQELPCTQLTPSLRRMQHCRLHRPTMDDSPVQTELARSAATERRAAFLEQRRERVAVGLARVDHTRSLREEQLQRLREKGRDVQRRLEMAFAGRQQRLQNTTEKCSERVAHAKAVAARLRQKQHDLKEVKMQKYIERLQENEARRCDHLRRRSNQETRSSETDQSIDQLCTPLYSVQSTIAIQRWWRVQVVKRAAAAFRAAIPRVLVHVLRGLPMQKLTFPIAQQLVALPEVTKATQTFLRQLGKVCPDVDVSGRDSDTRDARLLLSSLVITLFPQHVLEQQGPAEETLIASASRLFSSFAKLVGLQRSARRTRLMMFVASWLKFRDDFTAWKRQDSTRLLASFHEHWQQLAALKQTVLSKEGAEHDESQSQWVPNIEIQQQEILRRVRQVAGQSGVNEFVASLSQPQASGAGAAVQCPVGPDGAGESSSISDESSPSESAESSCSPPAGDRGDDDASGQSRQAGGGARDNGRQGGPPPGDEPSDGSGEAASQQGSSTDVMAMAQNLELAHELILDENFALKKVEAAPGSIMAQVQNTMMTAYWDILRDQLKQEPPVLDQVPGLLFEVKENLLATLPSQRETSVHRQINAGLDIDHIKQRIRHGVLDIKSLAFFVMEVMAQVCAPVRDEAVQCLRSSLQADTLDIAATFKGVLDLLSLMRLDLANHELQNVRPLLLQHAARYEREKFQELFPDAPASGLEHTMAWLTNAQQRCAIAGSGQSTPLAVLQQAFADLVTENMDHVPETWWLDTERIAALFSQLHNCVLVQCILVLVSGVLGHRLANDAEFMAQLRDTLFILLDDGTMSPSAAGQAAGHLAVQVGASANNYHAAHNLAPLDDVITQKVEMSVSQAFSEENPVRVVLFRRMKACTKLAVSRALNGPKLDAPPGFQLVAERMATILTSVGRLTTYNQKVFGPIYRSLLQKLFQS